MMKWFFTIAGGHTHVRVFMNGAKCGDLCFRNEEFHTIVLGFMPLDHLVTLIDETPKSETP